MSRMCSLIYTYFVISLFFFFQAEDGIRDGHVTGVQTCALPICRGVLPPVSRGGRSAPLEADLPPRELTHRHAGALEPGARLPIRSEERRVGKECRSGWSA